MTSSGAMLLPDWSDDDDDEREIQQPPSPQTRSALLEQVEEYKSILRSINYQEATDLRHSLASRAHLESLVDRYWDHCLKVRAAHEIDTEESGNGRTSSEEATKLEDEIKFKLKEMILHHPSFRKSPLLLRWPLLAADVPKPTWPLSDEILSILERQRRATISKENESIIEPIDIEIALPAMISCQHALVGVLHDLIIKSESHSSNSSSSTSNRVSIFTWRDILSTLVMRSDVPESVFKATQGRLEAIYGQNKKSPPAFWTSNMGIGGTDMILETLKRQNGIPLKHQTIRRPTVEDIVKERQSGKRRLDKEILLAPVSKKARYLEDAPVKSATKRSGLQSEQ